MKKKKIFLVLVLILAIIMLPVVAKEKIEGFYADEKIDLRENINRTSFIAGETVNVSSKINGLSFIAGNKINLNNSQDYMFVAGNEISLNETNTKDAFIVGSKIDIKDSNIRDLYAAAEKITIDSDLEGNLYFAGDKVEINSKISGDVNIAADQITIGDEAEITGTIRYPEEANIDIASSAKISKKKIYKGTSAKTEETIIDKAVSLFTSYLSLLIIGLLLLAFSRKMFKAINKINKDVETLFKTMGLGFLFLIAIPIVAIILLITTIGIPLSIISILVYGILIYLSAIPTAYYLGKWLLKDKISNDYSLLAVSLLIIYILKVIPVIGGLIGFVSLLIGLGIYTTLILKISKMK